MCIRDRLNTEDRHPTIVVPSLAKNIAGASVGFREKSDMFSNGAIPIKDLAAYKMVVGPIVLAGGYYAVFVIDTASRFARGVEVMAACENAIPKPFKSDNPIMDVNGFDNPITFSSARPGKVGRYIV